MAYIIAVLFGLTGFYRFSKEGLDSTVAFYGAVVIISMLWIVSDKYRSKNRDESTLAGMIFWLTATPVALNHAIQNYSFAFWGCILFALFSAACYLAAVWKQIHEKRSEIATQPTKSS